MENNNFENLGNENQTPENCSKRFSHVGAEKAFNGKNGAYLFYDWRFALSQLSNRSYRLVVEAIFDYQQYGTYPDWESLDRDALNVLCFVLPQLERQTAMREKGYAGQLKKAEMSNNPERIEAARAEMERREQFRDNGRRERGGQNAFLGNCFSRKEKVDREYVDALMRKMEERSYPRSLGDQNSK